MSRMHLILLRKRLILKLLLNARKPLSIHDFYILSHHRLPKSKSVEWLDSLELDGYVLKHDDGTYTSSPKGERYYLFLVNDSEKERKSTMRGIRDGIFYRKTGKI